MDARRTFHGLAAYLHCRSRRGQLFRGRAQAAARAVGREPHAGQSRSAGGLSPGSLPDIPEGCASEYLADVPSVLVAAPGHALAKKSGALSRAALSKHVQLVLTDRSTLTAGRQFGVMSPQVWRLADLGAKHAFLRAGLGWGSMPLHMVEHDLANGSLVRLEMKVHPLLGAGFSMHAIWLEDQPPGPAGRWFVDQLKNDSV